MKSSTRLDSAMFQLTPTRTRYVLFIVANGIKEKLTSGLLNRFLAHLKTAEDQISKGSYSIILEPKDDDDDDAMWFTKGTVERFVRFVSTPEILERVYTIESEIVQIGKAILIQGNNESGINSVEDHQAKPVPRTEACNGSNFTLDSDEETTMVLYTPVPRPPETNGSDAQEGNSKFQLLKVLETRINVLRKEQGMAFARASAAGFDIDHMAPLVSFAKCFGALRLMDACLKFLDLWKGKHETGQWLETKTAEAMPKLEFSTANATGTILCNEKAAVDESADIRPPVNQHNPISQHEYLPGQYPHHMFPPWPMHSPPSVVPFYQGPPTQTPYYQNYSPNGSYYQSPYETWENSQINVGQRRHSMEGITEPDSGERHILRMKSAYGLEDDNETSHLRSQKKADKSGKKHLGTVVNGKINIITSGMDSNSESESEVDKGDGDLCHSTPSMMDQDHLRSFRRKESQGKPASEMTLHDKEEASTADGENWQAFQNCLLRDTEEDFYAPSDTIFARKRNIQIRPQHKGDHDPSDFVKRDSVQLQARRLTESQKYDEYVSNFPGVSNDEFSVYREGTHHSGRLETGVMHMTGFEGRNIVYKNEIYEVSIGSEKECQSNLGRSSDLAINGCEITTDNLAYMVDESFTLPFRSTSVNQVDYINFELPSTHQSSVNVGKRIGNQVRYEHTELSLLPERWSENWQIGYDPALDYKKQLLLNDAASKHTESATDAKQESKKTEGKKSRAVSETLDKKKSRGPLMKGKPSKTNPLEEAQIRAERLRSYKTDLQKLKKEKEEAEQRRIESLRMERKKRIAARGSLTSGHSLLPCASRQALPAKLSPISHKGSKFSDSEPGSSSPLQRSKIRTALFGASDPKVSMVPKSVDTSHKTVNRLTRSVSVTKTESNVTTPDSKASMARIRRLSEPKTVGSHSRSSAKMSSAGSASKVKASSNEFEGKKASATTTVYHRSVVSFPEFKIEPHKGPVKVNQKKSAEKEFVGKKASGLANSDNRKVVSLPESEIEPSKGPVKVKQKRLAEKKMTLNINGGKSFVTSANDKLEGFGESISNHDLDDDPVIEKTVVMLECQKPSAPVVPASEEKLSVSGRHNHNNVTGDITLAVPEYKSIYATTSPLDRVQKEPTIQTLELPSSNEAMTNNMEKISANLPVTSALIKSDEVPSAQVSSLEYRSSMYGKLQLTSLGSASVKTGELHNSGFKHMKLEKVPKALEPVKEPSKSLKRFLKLGRRNHSSTSSAGEQIAESHSGTIANGSEPREIAAITDSTIKVHTLRNLLSQEETQKPTAPQSSQKCFARQTRLQFSTSPSDGNKADKAATEKSMDIHTGTFPKPSHIHKEIGGSLYSLKELLQNAKEKIFGSLKVQSDSSNDVKSTSIAKVMTTQENGLGKSRHGETSNTQEDAACSKSNSPPSSAPYTSGEISSDMMVDAVLDANRSHNDLENTGSGKPRNTTQSSAEMIYNAENSSVSRKIPNATANHCSEVLQNATVLKGVCDAYQTGFPEAASDFSVNSIKEEAVSNNQNHFQKIKECVQLEELQDPFEKSEKLSSLIYEVTRPRQVKVEDKMVSTGARNQMENKMYVDRYDKKVIEPPAAEPENGLLDSVGKSSEAVLCSDAEVTAATMQESVPNPHVSDGNGLNQPENQQNFPGISPDNKVSKEGEKPASGDAAQKLSGSISLFNNLVDHEEGKIMNKCNISETDGHLESSEEVSQGNLPNPFDIKGCHIGPQVAIDPGSVISKKTDQNHYSDQIRVLSQVNLPKLDNAGWQISSCHSYEENTEKDSSFEAPVEKVNKHGKIYSQQKSIEDSAELNAKESKSDACVPPIGIRQLDKGQDTTSSESLDRNKVLVKFVHKEADEQKVIEVLKCCGNILKIELSGVGQSSFQTAIVYFEKREGMQKALQMTDLLLRGVALNLETASSLESRSEKITIPSLIGDPDAPVALLKNPTRTVAIKQMTCEIFPRHIEKALAFCESNISGFFLGSSDSVAYVEFETEDGKERALAEQSIVVLGKRLFIFRVDTPRTTVVRVKTMLASVDLKKKLILESIGKIRAVHRRSPVIFDVHFCISEWPNMLQIVNEINGMQVDGMKLIAEPAPIVPPDVLCHIYSEPEERKRLKDNMIRWFQKLEGNPTSKKRVTDKFSKFLGEQ